MVEAEFVTHFPILPLNPSSTLPQVTLYVTQNQNLSTGYDLYSVIVKSKLPPDMFCTRAKSYPAVFLTSSMADCTLRYDNTSFLISDGDSPFLAVFCGGTYVFKLKDTSPLLKSSFKKPFGVTIGLPAILKRGGVQLRILAGTHGYRPLLQCWNILPTLALTRTTVPLIIEAKELALFLQSTMASPIWKP